MEQPDLTKDLLRKQLREVRRAHVKALPDATRSLLFLRPPAPLLERVPEGACVGLYRATPFEAPTASYARFFFDRGHALALPRFVTRSAPMTFARFADPYDESDLEVGPFALLQPLPSAPLARPDVLFIPVLGFTATGGRLGQGGGHYDRWLADHPQVTAIGLAWDAQLVEDLPMEEHDIPLAAVVTPTRIYGPF